MRNDGSTSTSQRRQKYTKRSDRISKPNSTRSKHFPTVVNEAIPHSLQQGGPRASKRRSSYFVSSPDSPAGSAARFDWGSAFTQNAVDAFRACPKFEKFGVRHLCKRLCYLHAYEPGRKWHALRVAVVQAGLSTRVLDNWCVRMDGGISPEHPWRISYVSPNGNVFPSAKPALASLALSDSTCGVPSFSSRLRGNKRERPKPPTAVADNCTAILTVNQNGRLTCGPTYLLKETWEGNPFPPSPFGLIEELLTDDPWKVLLGCIMLNQTTRSQMDPVLVRFLERFPDAATTASASLAEVTRLAGPLGLQEKRPVAIIRFSQEYLRMEWKIPEELHWIGKYAADAHKIFIERRWRDVHPTDHALSWWIEWMRGTNGGIAGRKIEQSPAALLKVGQAVRRELE